MASMEIRPQNVENPKSISLAQDGNEYETKMKDKMIIWGDDFERKMHWNQFCPFNEIIWQVVFAGTNSQNSEETRKGEQRDNS